MKKILVLVLLFMLSFTAVLPVTYCSADALADEYFIELDLANPVMNELFIPRGGFGRDGDYKWKFRHNNKAKEVIFTQYEVSKSLFLLTFGKPIAMKTVVINCDMYIADTKITKTIPVTANVVPWGVDETLKGNIFNGHFVLYAELLPVSFSIDKDLYNKIVALNSDKIEITFSGHINRETRFIIPVDKEFKEELYEGQGRTQVPFALTSTKNEETYSESTKEFWEDIFIRENGEYNPLAILKAMFTRGDDMTFWEGLKLFLFDSRMPEYARSIAWIITVAVALFLFGFLRKTYKWVLR